MNKYKKKIPRDDLKRFAKEIAKKLVSSDFKSDRVKDPTKIDEKHQQKVKKFCKEYFDKAAYKHKKHEHDKAVGSSKKVSSSSKHQKEVPPSLDATPTQESPVEDKSRVASPDTDIKNEDFSDDEDIKMSDNESEEADSPTDSPSVGKKLANRDVSSLKRKRSPLSTEINLNDIKAETYEDDEEDPDLGQSPRKKLNPEPAASATSESPGDNSSLKRKRSPLSTEMDLKDIKAEYYEDEEDPDLGQSPHKKLNLDRAASATSESPPPPPPPPAPPADSPPDLHNAATPEEANADADTDTHAETSFKQRSMADVLAQAQAEDDGDEEVMQREHVTDPNSVLRKEYPEQYESRPSPYDEEDSNNSIEMANEIYDDTIKREQSEGNPMVDGQPVG